MDTGFPDLDKAQYSLKSLQCERFGFIWVIATPDVSFDFDAYYAPIAAEAEGLDLASMAIAHEEKNSLTRTGRSLSRAVSRSYHFKVAHRKTIGPYFEDNLSSYQMLGDHMRSVLVCARVCVITRDQPTNQWRLRDHANIIYTFFPTTQLLVQRGPCCVD